MREKVLSINRLTSGSLLCLVVFLSNISQMSIWVKSNKTQLIAYPIWIVAILAIVLKNRIKLHDNIRHIVYVAFLFFFTLFVFSIVTAKTYYQSSMVYSYGISLLSFFVGTQLGIDLSDGDINNILLAYVISTVLVSLQIYFTYFGVGYVVDVTPYTYSSKNSLGFLVMTTIFILIISIKTGTIAGHLLRVSAIIFEVYFLAIMRARAVLISFILCVPLVIFSHLTRQKFRMLAVSLGILGIPTLLFSSRVISKLGVIFANQKVGADFFSALVGNGINSYEMYTLTGGRNLILLEFRELLKDNVLFGAGAMYYECFPLSVILQFGIICGSLLIVYACFPLLYGIKERNYSKSGLLLFSLALSYLIDSITDGLAPFGPGIRCYFLWLFFGIFCCRKKMESKIDY